MDATKDYLSEFQLSEKASPHFKNRLTSQRIFIDVMIALILPTVAAMYYFDWQRVLLMVVIGIASAVGFEYLYQKLTRQRVQIYDGSAAVTGYLIALCLPTTAPIWTLLLGTAFGIIITKQLGGGIGKNQFNPAASARVMQKVLLTPWITNWVLPGVDAVSTATPLEYIGHFSRSVPQEVPDLWDLFLGMNLGGPMGETSKVAILLAFLYLVLRKTIAPRIPLTYLFTLWLCAFLWSGFDLHYSMTHLLSGTAIFGAVFMVTDYSSSPITPKGHMYFAIGAAVLCFMLRILFNLPGGFGIALLIMNAFVPLIDKYCAPTIYGQDAPPRVSLGREPKGVAEVNG